MSGTDYGAGLDAVHRAVAQDPRSGAVLALAFSAMIFGDDLEGARRHLDQALAFAPTDPNLFLNLTMAGLLELFSGRAEAAADYLERSVALNPNWDSPYWVIVAAYVRLGRLPAARAARQVPGTAARGNGVDAAARPADPQRRPARDGHGRTPGRRSASEA